MKKYILTVLAIAFVACGKPKFVDDCVMYVSGSGWCNITNVGSGTGYAKVEMSVYRKWPYKYKSVASDEFYVGAIKPYDFRYVKFFLSGVHDECSGHGSWTKVCSWDINVRPVEPPGLLDRIAEWFDTSKKE